MAQIKESKNKTEMKDINIFQQHSENNKSDKLSASQVMKLVAYNKAYRPRPRRNKKASQPEREAK